MNDQKKGKLVYLDTEVVEALRKKSEGFDSPNQVLRRMLKLPPRAEEGKGKKGNAR